MKLDTIGKRLKHARESHPEKLSQADLARIIGVQQAIISKIERDKVKDTRYIVELALALGVNIEWLKHGLGVMKNTPAKPTGQLARLAMMLEPLNLTEDELKEVVNVAIIKASEITAQK
ncbi:helix-turn-helix domain-containing protein [Photobacterium damselae subsp. damselae]|uniref:helix-turn-helix domain-containing protein n=1 Tax=Photobacterium damselae TaxID=38293 RepID=UPI001F3AC4EA|nr:helix-turn-helix transcriptional regulator [Photobacterium damselae]UKA27165.1 helix-turn-helix domain-containing protein [Photobacterium damselae subsp. damselae]